MRLIDGDALLEKVWDADTRVGYVQVVDRGDIEEAPTIEERKQGKAIVKSTGYRGYWACDQCGTQINSTDNFCHHCGSDLRGNQK